MRIVVAVAAFASSSVITPSSARAQAPQPAQPLPPLGSGCSGTGPGIIIGRAPAFTDGTVGSIRIVPGDDSGDAFLAVTQEIDAATAWVMKISTDPKAAAAYKANPTYNPVAPRYTGPPNDLRAFGEWQNARLNLYKKALAAASTMATAAVNKDGSFTCRGLASGRYHVILMTTNVPRSAVLAPSATTHGIRQESYESDVVIPRVGRGQRVLVEVGQYHVLMTVKS